MICSKMSSYVNKVAAVSVAAFGNGKNGQKRFTAAAEIGIDISEGEGCAADELLTLGIREWIAFDGLTCGSIPNGFKATLGIRERIS